MLVFDYVKNKLKKEELLALYAAKIEDIFATLYRQINFTCFERRIHANENELKSEENFSNLDGRISKNVW